MIGKISLAVACLFAATTAQAATTVDTAGSRLLVRGVAAADGQTLGGAEFNGSTDVAPFDILVGRDSASNFTAAWTHSYAAIADTITGASVQLGLFDVDGDVAGDQVASFTLNGIDLTAALNAAVNAKTFTGDSKYGIYDVALSADTYAALADGELSFALALSGPARNVLGSTQFNAAILDYSSVTVTTGAVPEPATWAMMALGFGALGGMMRRSRQYRGVMAV